MAPEEGVVEAWPRFGDTRAWFAADLALNIVMENDPVREAEAARDFLSRLIVRVTAMMRFAEAASVPTWTACHPGGGFARIAPRLLDRECRED
jgi:hypothetical protein